MNADVFVSVVLPITLFCIMFGMGATLTRHDFGRVVHRPRAFACGIASQMILLPLLALVTVTLFELPPEIVVGLMILAFSPGGTVSNLFSYLALGNVALSISLTALTSLITPISLPLLSALILEWQFGSTQDVSLPFAQTFAKLVVLTLVPLGLGMLLRHHRSGLCLGNEKWLTGVPGAMLLIVIGVILYQNWGQMPGFLKLAGAPALLLASAAILVGHFFARAMRQATDDTRSIAIETGVQNGGVAILVTGTIIDNPAMTVAPAIYGLLMYLPTTAYLIGIHLTRSRRSPSRTQ